MIKRLMKKTTKAHNSIRIPQFIIDMWGRDYYMEIYKNKIILKPVREVK